MPVKYDKSISCEKIICIGKHQPFAVGVPETNIAGVTGTATFFVENASGVLALQTRKVPKVYFLCRAVVIDHNNLHLWRIRDGVKAPL